MADLDKKEGFFKGVFLVASLYDLILGIIFLTMYKAVYSYFNIALPTYPMYLQMSAAFVFAIGVGYYFVYRNMYRNIDLIKLGVVYKATYSIVASYFYFIGIAHVLFFWFVIFDVIFLVLFVWFLVYARNKEY